MARTRSRTPARSHPPHPEKVRRLYASAVQVAEVWPSLARIATGRLSLKSYSTDTPLSFTHVPRMSMREARSILVQAAGRRSVLRRKELHTKTCRTKESVLSRATYVTNRLDTEEVCALLTFVSLPDRFSFLTLTFILGIFLRALSIFQT